MPQFYQNSGKWGGELFNKADASYKMRHMESKKIIPLILTENNDKVNTICILWTFSQNPPPLSQELFHGMSHAFLDFFFLFLGNSLTISDQQKIGLHAKVPKQLLYNAFDTPTSSKPFSTPLRLSRRHQNQRPLIPKQTDWTPSFGIPQKRDFGGQNMFEKSTENRRSLFPPYGIDNDKLLFSNKLFLYLPNRFVQRPSMFIVRSVSLKRGIHFFFVQIHQLVRLFLRVQLRRHASQYLSAVSRTTVMRVYDQHKNCIKCKMLFQNTPPSLKRKESLHRNGLKKCPQNIAGATDGCERRGRHAFKRILPTQLAVFVRAQRMVRQKLDALDRRIPAK